MPIYHGKSADGSDMREWDGVFVNPQNPDQWSAAPYNKEQSNSKKESDRNFRIRQSVQEYMNGKFCLDDVKKQIEEKKCPLSKTQRDWVMDHYDEQGNFLYGRDS